VSLKYAVLVFRNANLDDARHVAFSRLFGELDDVKPYLTLGRKNRFPFDELFDVSNQEDDGSIVQVGSKREQTGRVCVSPFALALGPRIPYLPIYPFTHLPPPDTHIAFSSTYVLAGVKPLRNMA
jgi:alpha-ketoglutarate-dependent 2,4-dichlorophenoxyacetate dioxygenase